MRNYYLLSLFISSMLLAGCAPSEETKKKVTPQDDFFQYVNQDWLATAKIPADRGRWGSFDELRENNNKVVLSVLEKAMNSDQYDAESDQKKAANFYQIGMDSALAEKHGITPLMPYLAMIDGIKDLATLQDYLAFQETIGGGAFFRLGVYPDQKNSTANALYIRSGGLGLPDRDYYLSTDHKSMSTVTEYKEYIEELFMTFDMNESLAHALAMVIVNLETDLARGTLDKISRRNPDKTYHKMSVAELSKLAPSIDWKRYLADVGLDNPTEVIVTEPAFLKTYDSLVTSTEIEDLRAYLKFHLINTAAPYMSEKYVMPNFEFYGTYLRGTAAISPRWKRVLGTTNRFLGEAIGKLYVEETFPPEAKEKTLEMVNNIKLAFGDRIQNLDWMSDETKEKALEKLKAFNVKIGYPDEWKSYQSMLVETGEHASFVGNVLNALRFQVEERFAKLNEPVDKSEWGMSPQTVNAYYRASANEIVFPAGILQPPFYDYKKDEAVNYGGIGAVIGHEISHGFDDRGSKFDGAGNRNNWWTDEDLAKFKARTGKLVDQYSAYEPIDSVFVNGEFTLGENIGDLGGINVAYDGLQRFFNEKGRPADIDGQTPEQRFFISWATIWRTKYTDETLRREVRTNPHAPGMYRANGPLVNMPEFHQAFDVKAGDNMYKAADEIIKIW
ncbi:MAG: M13 family metallopeptidase [Flammeovirgaceae bacterium]